MYLPRHFEQNDPQALAGLMHAHPLATLVVAGPDGLSADHVPLLWDPEARLLHGHVARANPLAHAAPGTPVLAVFQGSDAYVSPAWYASKAEHGKVVPTWNYAVVHARGTLRPIDDAAWLRTFLGRLTERHESTRAKPWAIGDAPADYIEQTLRAIVGIEIAVDTLAGKWKVSQNRSAADRAGVVRGLREDGHEAMAGWVERGGTGPE